MENPESNFDLLGSKTLALVSIFVKSFVSNRFFAPRGKMKDDHFVRIIVSKNLSPEGQEEILILTVEEYEKARRRGETVRHNREKKGVKNSVRGYDAGCIGLS